MMLHFVEGISLLAAGAVVLWFASVVLSIAAVVALELAILLDMV